MTITQVMYLLEIARCGSISKAAERLYISQPALSAQMRKLEAELGCELLRREHQGISLTAAGKHFCKTAEPVGEAWRILEEESKHLSSAVCAQVRVGVGPRAISNGLLNVLLSFFDSHPDTNLTLITDIGENTLRALEEHRMDLAIDRLPPDNLFPHRERFYISPLMKERQCVLMSHSDPRAGRRELLYRELHKSPFVSGTVGSLDDVIMKDLCRKYSIMPGRVYRADNFEAVMSLIQHGKGVAFGPESFAKHFNVAAVPVNPKTDIYLNLICLRENRNNALVIELNSLLKQQFSY
ncbi:MAG: LysR family transcriptional regulator [Oscillospiraceae bacterium]|nr:LysR family transcriptional regulator [Oscillospiraceae bacterium]